MKILDESVTKEEFVKAFENVINLVLKIEKKNTQAVDSLEKTYGVLMEKVLNDHTSSLSDLKKQVDHVFVGSQVEKMLKEHEERMKKVDDSMTKIEERMAKVKDGYTPVKGKDFFDGRNGADGTKLSPQQMRDKLETLKGDERTDKSAIRGIEELEKEIKDLKEQVKRSKGGIRGMRKIPIVKRYRLTDQCDGVTKSFNLPMDTVDVLGVFGTQFPINYDPYNSSGGDWSLNGRTLTLGDGVSAPQTGQTLWVLIEVLFY